MNKLEQKRTERKKQILAEAKKLILERGISDGIMSELAARSGISRQRLYVYYNNIDDVLRDIVENIYIGSYVNDLFTTPYDNPEAVIRYAILASPTVSEDTHDELLLLSLFSVYSATNNKDLRSHTKRILLFEKQIHDGQVRGVFRTDRPVEYLSVMVTHMVTSFLFHAETLTSEWRANLLCEEILGRLADMVLDYLKAK